MEAISRFETMVRGITLLALSLFVVSTAYASDRAPAVGMNSGEVQRVWGDPEERISYETKREVLWRYDGSEVRFREGKVVAWRYLDERIVDGAGAGDVSDVAGDVDGKEVAVADILTEIMREMPADQAK